MDLAQFSRQCSVRRLTQGDVPAVLALCQGNPLYYEYCPPAPTEESIRADMAALPPGKTPDDKFYVGFYSGGALSAVMDLIAFYPDDRTAFIGFFMTDAAVQRRGVGSRIVGELCVCLAQQGFASVRLGWMAGNPQAERFWHKNGFWETGKTHDRNGRKVVSAYRPLTPRDS